MPVEIKVDAEIDRPLVGEVEHVGVLPDSENRRFNPDQKVYKTSIKIAGIHDWIKPGMAAQARIIIRVLPDVVKIPVQSVFNQDDRTFCCVQVGARVEVRLIDVEDYNNRFAAIRSGLEEGETVFLSMPDKLDLSPLDRDRPTSRKDDSKSVPIPES